MPQEDQAYRMRRSGSSRDFLAHCKLMSLADGFGHADSDPGASSRT